MRSLSPSFVTLLCPLLAIAQGLDHHAMNARHHQARQATSTSVPSVPPTGSATGSGATSQSNTSSGTGSGTGSVTTPSTTYTFTLASTNPTAIPLSLITPSQQSAATRPLDSTAAAGATPTFIPGAPALPDVSRLRPADYPALDKPPPTDSPEVAQWKAEVASTGINIPDLSPTNPGGCLNNSAIATDPSRCWWTCTGCTRDADITKCPQRMQWGLTYDDGPGFYTSNLLQYLDEKDIKSTFFVVGSRAISFPHILQTQYMGQHQIAVHTWSHSPLTTQTTDQIIAELGWSRKIIKDVLGVTPNMMRPPFGDIDDRVRAISIAMGLVPVMWTRTGPASTFDTDDFNIHNGVTPVQKVLQNWQNIIHTAPGLDSGFIVLEHDLFQESVEVATGYILPDALAQNPPFQIQPVVSCLGRSLADGYIETNNNKTNPPLATAVTGGSSSGNGGNSGGSGGNNNSNAGRLYPLNPTLVTGLILGFTGFAAGFFAVLRV